MVRGVERRRDREASRQVAEQAAHGIQARRGAPWPGVEVRSRRGSAPHEAADADGYAPRLRQSMARRANVLARRCGRDPVHPATGSPAPAAHVGAAAADRRVVRTHARACVGDEGAPRAAARGGPRSMRQARDRSVAAGKGDGMGVLIAGLWREDEELPQETGTSGDFKRVESAFRDRITADGSSGYKAQAGRYHLYVAWNCPWAHRTLIFLALKKLQGAISVAYAIPGLREQGWTFEANPAFVDCTPDKVNGFRYLHQAYAAAEPRYTGKVTVPTLWDKKTRKIVNNESSEIIRMLNSEFRGIAGDDTDYYPPQLRGEIDRINDFVYARINNGVYRCGFARSQEAYDAAYDALFSALDEIEARLSRQPYLAGKQIT